AKLGSINHTLLTLDVVKRQGLNLLGIVYNEYPTAHPRIMADSQQVFRTFLSRFGCKDTLVAMPKMNLDEGDIPERDFSALFKN
ncbi:dethiobiotin synthase, partial [candidate division KSB3 bacterium]